MKCQQQGGKSWQPFGEGKNGQKSFVWRIFAIFATKAPFFRVLANSIQYNTQYISCNSALLAQETLFLTPKALFSPKIFQKLRKIATKLIIATTGRVLGLEIFVRV